MELAGPQDTKALELRLLDKGMAARIRRRIADWAQV